MHRCFGDGVNAAFPVPAIFVDARLYEGSGWRESNFRNGGEVLFYAAPTPSAAITLQRPHAAYGCAPAGASAAWSQTRR